MPDSSTKTISLPSRWAFFKRRPGAALPAVHGILIALDCALVRLLRTKTQRAQNAPDMGLAEAHAVHALNENAHALDRPQLGPKSMGCRALQEGGAYLRQLCLLQLCGPTPLRYGPQCVDATFIEQCLPCVHRLACHAYGKSHFGTALAFLQHSPCSQSLLRSLAQSLLHHVCILQEQPCRYNA